MKEPAFKLLKEGLPKHLQNRLIYSNSSASKEATIVARGLGAIVIDKQVEELITWLGYLKKQIPNKDGISENEGLKNEKIRNENVLSLT